MQAKTSAVEIETRCSLCYDTSEAEGQLNELMELLKSRFPDGVPDEIIGNLASLSLDIILTDNRSTVRADGTVEISQGFEVLNSSEPQLGQVN